MLPKWLLIAVPTCSAVAIDLNNLITHGINTTELLARGVDIAAGCTRPRVDQFMLQNCNASSLIESWKGSPLLSRNRGLHWQTESVFIANWDCWGGSHWCGYDGPIKDGKCTGNTLGIVHNEPPCVNTLSYADRRIECLDYLADLDNSGC